MDNAGGGLTVKHVLIIDFGGQYSHLIARRIRELEVYGEFVSHTIDTDNLLEYVRESYGVILSGGPASVWEGKHDDIIKLIIKEDKPILGICYGHQLLARALGGIVQRSHKPEFGPTTVFLKVRDRIFKGIPNSFIVWMSHNDAVIEPPPGAEVLAYSHGSPVAAMRYGIHYGIQWHPEVAHTSYGMKLLSNWLDIIGAPRVWKLDIVVDKIIEDIRGVIGDSIAVAAISGGIDSTTATLIAYKSIGSKLKPVIIDHGLHPQGEPARSIKLLESIGLKPILVDASDMFIEALKGITDPEEKRRIFGKLYAEVLEEEALKLGAEYLVQGTIYPDIIESGGRPGASIIKTHHNVAGLPRNIRLKIVEPLKWFYKDEVRRIARKLGVPEEIIKRQPIPGPALAVRIEGEVTREKIDIVRRADAIVREEIENSGIQERLWQYFAILLNSKATGVKGDNRAYGYVVVVRAVISVDAMTASIARLQWDLLERIASRITSEIPQVTRVLYDITSKPPATIEWE
ncbi:MAG: glutamine-hydrolyzing GMP synthase [Acidilobaceae archaeon]